MEHILKEYKCETIRHIDGEYYPLSLVDASVRYIKAYSREDAFDRYGDMMELSDSPIPFKERVIIIEV